MKTLVSTFVSVALLSQSMLPAAYAGDSNETLDQTSILQSACFKTYKAKIRKKLKRRQDMNKVMKVAGEVIVIGGASALLGVGIAAVGASAFGGSIAFYTEGFIKGSIAVGASGFIPAVYFQEHKAHAPQALVEATQVAELSGNAYRAFLAGVQSYEPNATPKMVEDALAEGFTSGSFCNRGIFKNAVLRPLRIEKEVIKSVHARLAAQK